MTSDIYLYANHPVIRVDGQYYAATANFVDFLSDLANRSERYVMILPCEEGTAKDVDNCVRLDIQSEVLELSAYRGHMSAIFTTFINAVRLRGLIMQRSAGREFCLAGPGPNSMMFWLSFFLPQCRRFYFFIRGDTVETIRHIYRRKWWGSLPVLVSSLFQWRIFRLLQSGKASVFTFGERLKKKYSRYGGDVYTIAPLITSAISEYEKESEREDSHEFRVVYVGRLSAEKGILELVSAVVRLLNDGMPLQLTIIGDGYLKSDICSQVENSGYADKIIVSGHVPAGPVLWDYLDRSDLLCLPSKTEGTPRVIVEAFARKLPVLATSVGSIPFMFPGDVVLMEGGQSDDICASLQWCVNNREELMEKGLHGQEGVFQYLLSYNSERVDAVMGKGC